MITPVPVVRSLGGIAASAAVASFAARAGALTPRGALAAVVVGSVTVGAGGAGSGASLVTLFASGSLLSRAGRSRKAVLADLWEKGDRRDAGQVLANGGAGALLLAASQVSHRRAFRVAAAASLAVAAADTWATELGSLTRAPARLITTGAVVPRGTSGAITPFGCLAALAGSLFVAVWFWLGDGESSRRALPLGLTALAGVAGSLVDSWLGATVQARYRCPACRRQTERRTHTCGTATILVGGTRWVGNDVVNVASTVAGGAIAAALDAASGRREGSAR